MVFETKLDHPFAPTLTLNRWNTERTRVAYASEHPALAALEKLVYWGAYDALRGYHLYTYEFDRGSVEDLTALAPDLDIFDKVVTRRYGDEWVLEGRSLLLRVPSVVMPQSFNYLINSRHADHYPERITHHGRFEYDPRLRQLVAEAKRRRS